MAGAVGTPTLVSRSEYARHCNVSPAAVTQWAAAGRIVIAEDGRVDLRASDVRLEQSGGASRGGKRTRGTTAGIQGASIGVRDPVAPPVGRPTLLDARTDQAANRARLDELEYRRQVAELVEQKLVEKAIADAIAPIMSGLESLSARLGPALAAETDVRKIQNMVDDAVDSMRRDVASTLRRMLPGANGSTQ